MMEKQNRTKGTEVQNPMFTAVETDRRRSILTILLDHPTSLRESELARAVAASEASAPGEDVPDKTGRNIRIDLRHNQLPVLRESGLVRWNDTNGIVTTSNHRALADPRFRQLLETEEDGVDDVLFGLSNGRRRYLLSVLREYGENRTAMSRSSLAREIAQHEGDSEDASQATFDEIVMTLVHVHLPMLAAAEIVRYNPKSGRVAYTGNPALERIVTIFHEPDNRFVNRLGGFFGGLLTSYQEASGSTETSLDWPSFWSDPHHG